MIHYWGATEKQNSFRIHEHFGLYIYIQMFIELHMRGQFQAKWVAFPGNTRIFANNYVYFDHASLILSLITNLNNIQNQLCEIKLYLCLKYINNLLQNISSSYYDTKYLKYVVSLIRFQHALIYIIENVILQLKNPPYFNVVC